MKPEGKNHNRINIILWLLQRVSGLALILIVPLHMWIQHYSEPQNDPKYADVISHLTTPGFIILEIALLALVLFHSLNGLRNIAIDYNLKEKKITKILLIMAIIFFCIGLAPVIFCLLQ